MPGAVAWRKPWPPPALAPKSLVNKQENTPRHDCRVHAIPGWLDARRLLGPGDWRFEVTPGLEERGALSAKAQLPREQAADLAARLRGVGLDGQPLLVELEPALPRGALRAGRTRDARARRETTPGFTRRDARCDDEGRMYLTPEMLALKMARSAGGRRVVDAGCGVGGNAIAFAREGCEVLAIERDGERAKLAAHNARVYGVAKRVRVETGDAVQRIQDMLDENLEDTLLFCDPPWGAQWDRQRTSLDDFPLLQQLLELRGAFHALWAKLPPSFETQSWPAAEPSAFFGEAEGDRRRVKFVLMRG